MAVQLPLNHLVTDLHRANETPLEVLEGNATSLSRKAMALSALEKISYVALVALVAVVFAVSYNLLVLTGAAPLVMAGMILASPILVIGSIKLAQLAKQYAFLAEVEQKTALHLRQIEHWNEAEIDAFFEQNRLNGNRVNLDALRQVNPQEPKKALLPLIARYNSLTAEIQQIRAAHEAAPGALEEGFRRFEEQRGQPTDSAIKQKIRFESKCTHWNKLELTAVPAALNAAALLCLIEKPTITDLDVQPGSFTITGVGTCAPRNYPERMFGKTNEPQNDDYFIFAPGHNKPPLSHAEIEELQMDPSRLKQRLFR